MYVMDEPQWKEFIASGTRTGKLATVRPDGRPHCVPIWFILDNDTLVFTSGATTVKTRNIEHEPRVALTLDVEQFPYDFVMIEATATIERISAAEQLPFTTAIAERYVPTGRAAEFGERNAADTEVLIRLRPDKVVAWGDLCG